MSLSTSTFCTVLQFENRLRIPHSTGTFFQQPTDEFVIDNFAIVSRSQYNYCFVRSTSQWEFCINVIVGPRAGAKGPGSNILSILYCCTDIINHAVFLSHRSLIFCASCGIDLDELCYLRCFYVHISEATECNARAL